MRASFVTVPTVHIVSINDNMNRLGCNLEAEKEAVILLVNDYIKIDRKKLSLLCSFIGTGSWLSADEGRQNNPYLSTDSTVDRAGCWVNTTTGNSSWAKLSLKLERLIYMHLRQILLTESKSTAGVKPSHLMLLKIIRVTSSTYCYTLRESTPMPFLSRALHL